MYDCSKKLYNHVREHHRLNSFWSFDVVIAQMMIYLFVEAIDGNSDDLDT